LLGSFPPSLGQLRSSKFTQLEGADAFIQSASRRLF
jgi:hypothetical protein